MRIRVCRIGMWKHALAHTLVPLHLIRHLLFAGPQRERMSSNTASGMSSIVGDPALLESASIVPDLSFMVKTDSVVLSRKIINLWPRWLAQLTL